MKSQTNLSAQILRVQELVAEINRHNHLYYNENSPEISDAEYDKLFDELKSLEAETGFILSKSPTQSVGAPVVMSELAIVQHEAPLLSLDKTKEESAVVGFVGGHDALMMLKLDGLTVNLHYDGGKLIRAATRGDGYEGEDITHNARVFADVPLEIPHKGFLSITGEAHILRDDFEHLRATTVGSDGKPYKNSRNLASGSARQYDAGECAKRRVRLSIFGVPNGASLEGAEYPDNSGETPTMIPVDINSKSSMLYYLQGIGFKLAEFHKLGNDIINGIPLTISRLGAYATERGIPIDGLVITYDDVAYSKSLGRTGNHYRDGLAFKFEDDATKTILRSITWKVTRSGALSCTANFDTIEIDGTDVSNASLHNLTFIEGLNLKIGDRVMVSKRNMIIPHIEGNLDANKQGDPNAEPLLPKECPCCKSELTTRFNEESEPTLYCTNKSCPDRILRQLRHFVSKKAMDVSGLSDGTLKKLMDAGLITNKIDIYNLAACESVIISMDGFGRKSFDGLVAAIEKSKTTTMEKFIIAMDIPMLGRHASAILCKAFNYDLDSIKAAAMSGFDFRVLQDFGDALHYSIHNWFVHESNVLQWEQISGLLTFKASRTQAAAASSETLEAQVQADSPFVGKTIVATGSFDNFTRDSINDFIESIGAKAGSSVSKKTDYVVVGEKAGSKKKKAEELGITTLSEAEFMEMAGA